MRPKRVPSKWRQTDVALGDRIEALHRTSTEADGRPCIQADLRDEKISVSDKRVMGLMRDRNLQGAGRRVVGWAIATHMRTELVVVALNTALQNRKPKNTIHLSDPGVAAYVDCRQQPL